MNSTRLDKYEISWYKPGNKIWRSFWYVFNTILLNSYLCPLSSVKRHLLRSFGAKIGRGVVIKPKVNIKYPWKLEIGDYSWIGEGVWIDNLDKVVIGKHACLSQGSMLLCGNHNYSKSTFDLEIKEIKLGDGVWISARSFVGPGVTCHSHSVLLANSAAYKDLDAYSIYRGNPAEKIKDRVIE